MANPEDIKKATQLQKYMPFSVVPDQKSFAIGGANYGQEKNIANAAAIENGSLYSYGGKVTGPFKPGTKTLAGKEFDLNKEKFAYGMQQDDIANRISMAKALSGGYGGGTTGTKTTAGNPGAFMDAVKAMNQEHTWWQQAQGSSGQTNVPHDFGAVLNQVLRITMDKNMPMTETEIKDLEAYAEKLRAQEVSMLNGYKGVDSYASNEENY